MDGEIRRWQGQDSGFRRWAQQPYFRPGKIAIIPHHLPSSSCFYLLPARNNIHIVHYLAGWLTSYLPLYSSSFFPYDPPVSVRVLWTRQLPKYIFIDISLFATFNLKIWMPVKRFIIVSFALSNLFCHKLKYTFRKREKGSGEVTDGWMGNRSQDHTVHIDGGIHQVEIN